MEGNKFTEVGILEGLSSESCQWEGSWWFECHSFLDDLFFLSGNVGIFPLFLVFWDCLKRCVGMGPFSFTVLSTHWVLLVLMWVIQFWVNLIFFWWFPCLCFLYCLLDIKPGLVLCLTCLLSNIFRFCDFPHLRSKRLNLISSFFFLLVIIFLISKRSFLNVPFLYN